jgi:predicted amidophosphoribosyltransferase
MIIKQLLELLFPSGIYCISCRSIIDNSRVYSLCDKCMSIFNWVNGRTCDKCGKMLQGHYLHNTCTDCREALHFFEKGYTCVQYGIHEREMLLSFKYGGKAFIGDKIEQIMADRLETEDLEIDLVIPVPMHKNKQKKRGYNQAEIIARRLARKLSLPYSDKLLIRTGNTAAMSSLSSFERRMNMESAFSITESNARKS